MVLLLCNVIFRLKIFAKREANVGGEYSKLIGGWVRSCKGEGIGVLACDGEAKFGYFAVP